MKLKRGISRLLPIWISSDEDENDDDRLPVVAPMELEIAPIAQVIEISDDEDTPGVNLENNLAKNELPDDDDRPLDQLVRIVEPCPDLNISSDSSDGSQSNEIDLDNVRWSSPSDSDSESSDFGDDFVNPMIPGNY